jgi:hypothetical protein
MSKVFLASCKKASKCIKASICWQVFFIAKTKMPPIKKTQMGCPALGIWVGFLKQPALLGEGPQNKNSSKKFKKIKNH